MATLEHITLEDLEKAIHSLHLPSNTRFTVIIENSENLEKLTKRKQALDAMKKLKNSGNGKLLSALLTERKKDSLL